MTPIINNLSISTTQVRDPEYICKIDQMELLNQVSKTPTYAYYFLLVATAILLIYILVPKIQEYVTAKQILYPIFMLLLTSLALYSFTTFNITRELYTNTIEPILYILTFFGVIYILWKEREHFKKMFKRET
jgi:hypothetical protein